MSFAESGLANEHADDRLGDKVFLQCAEGMRTKAFEWKTWKWGASGLFLL